MSLAVGSMCTGYGGLDAGVMSILGGELAWTADNDPGASAVIEHRMPGTPNLGDIKTVAWENIQPVDILCVGFPCQPVSSAGKQKGTADERWLWPCIADSISRMGTRPGLLMLENVPRLLTIEGGAAISQVLGTLSQLGYVGCYGIISAAEAGAAHLRKRWFCLAADALGVGRTTRQPSPDWHRPGAGYHEAVPDSDRGMRQRWPDQQVRRQERGKAAERSRSAAFPDTQCHRLQGRERDDTDTGQAAGARRPEPAPGNRGHHEAFPDPGSPRLERALVTRARHDQERHRESPDDPAGRPPFSGTGPDWQEYEPAVRRWEVISGYPAPCPVEPGRNGNHRMTAEFPEWLMGLPPGWVTAVPGLSRSAKIRVIGNGVVPQQAALATACLLNILRET